MSDPFEDQLARTPRRELPPEWRSEILLAAAEATATTTTRPRSSHPAGPSWWMGLWLRLPVPTVGFGAACVLTVLLSTVDPWGSDPMHTVSRPISREQIAAARAERNELLQAFYLVDGGNEPPSESKPRSERLRPAILPRPRSDRRSPEDDGFGITLPNRFMPLV